MNKICVKCFLLGLAACLCNHVVHASDQNVPLIPAHAVMTTVTANTGNAPVFVVPDQNTGVSRVGVRVDKAREQAGVGGRLRRTIRQARTGPTVENGSAEPRRAASGARTTVGGYDG
jgi:hypothetical protein